GGLDGDTVRTLAAGGGAGSADPSARHNGFPVEGFSLMPTISIETPSARCPMRDCGSAGGAAIGEVDAAGVGAGDVAGLAAVWARTIDIVPTAAVPSTASASMATAIFALVQKMILNAAFARSNDELVA